MNAWIDDLVETLDRDRLCVLVTVAGVRGSAPRETGAKMIVTKRDVIGTIGGGQLEFQCARIAATLFSEATRHSSAFVRKFPLAANCGQCCGGVVDILFEPITEKSLEWLGMLREKVSIRQPVLIATSLQEAGRKMLLTADGFEYGAAANKDSASALAAAWDSLPGNATAWQEGEFLLQPIMESDLHIVVFGAGHVGAATVDVLSRLDSHIRWIDSRKNIFAPNLPSNVFALESADPASETAAMPSASYCLVMTHSHPLDLAICARILRRPDVAYCGLIGSLSKRRRFERLLRKQGITNDELGRLTCPIGIDGIHGKQPVEIAVSVAAEILRIHSLRKSSVTGIRDSNTVVRAI